MFVFILCHTTINCRTNNGNWSDGTTSVFHEPKLKWQTTWIVNRPYTPTFSHSPGTYMWKKAIWMYGPNRAAIVNKRNKRTDVCWTNLIRNRSETFSHQAELKTERGNSYELGTCCDAMWVYDGWCSKRGAEISCCRIICCCNFTSGRNYTQRISRVSKNKSSVSPPEISVNIPPSSPTSHTTWENTMFSGLERRGLPSHCLDPLAPAPATGKRDPVCAVLVFTRNIGRHVF